MFQSPELKEHLETSSVIRNRSLVVAEWNLNVPENIFRIGNYRYRPAEKFTLPAAERSAYSFLNNSFDPNDNGNFYTGATDADILIDGGYEENDIPVTFKSKKEKENLLYSLEDCFGKFRPRSGINKLRYFDQGFTHHSNPEMSSRPRYYMASKDDKFKYWTSYRTEVVSIFTPERNELSTLFERGIANQLVDGRHYIDDVAPFVVYKESVPANRIVVKMQTNVGTVDLGPFSNNAGSFDDPLYGNENQSTPVRWSIQYLENNTWLNAVTFNEESIRETDFPVIGPDGYVEIAYGLLVPNKYKTNFFKVGEIFSESMLPNEAVEGQAYLVKTSEEDLGLYYVWYNNAFESFTPSYGWFLNEQSVDGLSSFATDLTSPVSFFNPVSGATSYREFQWIDGLRIVVETMNKDDATFDLIELSPRLVSDISDKTVAFSLRKPASDLGVSGMPVGQLLAGTGDITIFDYDLAFSKNNDKSVIAPYIIQNTQIKFYEVVSGVSGYDYYVPLKTMFSEGFPEINNTERQVRMNLRDQYFYFESLTAPQLFIPGASLSYAVSLLLDSIGFSNYVFRRFENESDPVIPFFFVPPEKSIAQVLTDLAISTQSTMFFDEYNNFIVMSKNYILPTEEERETDLVLYGSIDFEDDGILENKATQPTLANIVDISSQENKVYNDGKISYTNRYIQRSYSSIRQASLVDRDKTWIYKPALLWEVAGEETTKSINDQSGTQSNFMLGAIPLNTDLSADLPTVANNTLINNVMDLGEGVYWLSRYNGYFYANSEIIKYDAVQYSIPGLVLDENAEDGNLVWITSLQEYQRYFAKIPFRGKMYPTGLVRIYSEPNYEVFDGITRLKNGPVSKHGRGQFGTPVVSHSAGLNSYWSDNNEETSPTRGCYMRSQYLFGNSFTGTLNTGAAGQSLPRRNSNLVARQSSRNGIIKNFLSSSFPKESEVNQLYSTQTGTIQSSALIMTGPTFDSDESAIDFITYINKPLSNNYKHFGTRMRIIGKINNDEIRAQSPSGSTSYYTLSGNTPNENISVGGSSGGIAVMIDPTTNNGYFFELVALTENNLENYQEESAVYNLLFYKVMNSNGEAIPVRLWGGLAQILVDDGNFTGQYRLAGEENPTVYDIAVEYEDVGSSRRFYLYINNKLVQIVTDDNPLPAYPNIGPFIRGNARVMFENIYALTTNYSVNPSASLELPANTAFSNNEISISESFRKYAMSGIIQSTYLSGISPAQPPEYLLYFDEFGTIMREAAYLNVKYDKAYPALYAQLSPTFNRIKGYTISGFMAGAYGAEFLVFNATDTAINLDESSGNYLRIQGITFTQESETELTVDDYFSKRSDFSNPQISGGNVVVSPIKESKDYYDIKTSRLTYGKNEFNLSAPYIQNQDTANELMSWMISKIMKPRMSVGVNIFSNPIIQLGDIVKIAYKDNTDTDQIASVDKRFVVYNIEYSRSIEGPSMALYLSEVV
jgi:hypothetical protein